MVTDADDCNSGVLAIDRTAAKPRESGRPRVFRGAQAPPRSPGECTSAAGGEPAPRFTEGVLAADARTPNPLAILITHVLQWAGWDDIDVRPIADYFRVAGLMASGTGPTIPWPLTVFTDEVQARLKVQPPSTGPGSFWDRWSMFV